MSLVFDDVSGYDAAFSGKLTQVVGHAGRTEPFDVGLWSSEPDWVDRALFIDPCDAETIDIGCGPGRLVGAIAARRIFAMGIDVSKEAVRLTRVRGALALLGDVFSTVPGEGGWSYALLADGNLGIGGDPVRLLQRVGEVLVPGGRIIAEVADHGVGLVTERRQFEVDGRLTEHFDWSVVGLDAIEEVAVRAGLRVQSTHSVGGRHTAVMVRNAA